MQTILARCPLLDCYVSFANDPRRCVLSDPNKANTAVVANARVIVFKNTAQLVCAVPVLRADSEILWSYGDKYIYPSLDTMTVVRRTVHRTDGTVL